MKKTDPKIECQSCGKIIRTLSLAKNQVVADNPYGHVAYCSKRECRLGLIQDMQRDGIIEKNLDEDEINEILTEIF